MASTKLTKTFSGSGSTTKFTASFWVKRSKIGARQEIIAKWYSGNNNATIRFLDDDTLAFVDYSGSTTILGKITNRKFRDTSAWYHIVCNIDTTQASSDDRAKIYVNGVQETSFASNTVYSQNASISWNNTWGNHIGWSGNDGYFDGSLSHIHVCDGYTYQASAFGSTDSTTGEWKIKTSLSVTYGNNGFFILKDGNSVTDQSGNSNNFTVGGGTLTKTEDNPSNVFATLNPLYGNGSYTFANGNNSLECNNTNNWGITVPATLGATSGKYYWEARQVAGSHTDYNVFSFIQTDYNYTGSNLIASAYLNGIQTHSGGTCTLYIGTNNNNYAKSGGSNISISDNDIVSFALDIDNQKGWIAKNGVWIDDLSGNAGNPTTGANALFTSSTIPSGQMYSPCSIQYYDPKCQYNFGNGYFGTTQISSAGTNASGNGIFEYDVPTGYTALSTKGLNL